MSSLFDTKNDFMYKTSTSVLDSKGRKMKRYEFDVVDNDSIGMFQIVTMVGGSLVTELESIKESDVGIVKIQFDVPEDKAEYFEAFMRTVGVDQTYLRAI